MLLFCSIFGFFNVFLMVAAQCSNDTSKFSLQKDNVTLFSVDPTTVTPRIIASGDLFVGGGLYTGTEDEPGRNLLDSLNDPYTQVYKAEGSLDTGSMVFLTEDGRAVAPRPMIISELETASLFSQLYELTYMDSSIFIGTCLDGSYYLCSFSAVGDSLAFLQKSQATVTSASLLPMTSTDFLILEDSNIDQYTVGTVDLSTGDLSFGTPVPLAGSAFRFEAWTKIDDSRALVIANYIPSGASSKTDYAHVVTVSGNTVSEGTSVVSIAASATSCCNAVHKIDDGKFIVWGGSSIHLLLVSGSTVTWHSTLSTPLGGTSSGTVPKIITSSVASEIIFSTNTRGYSRVTVDAGNNMEIEHYMQVSCFNSFLKGFSFSPSPLRLLERRDTLGSTCTLLRQSIMTSSGILESFQPRMLNYIGSRFALLGTDRAVSLSTIPDDKLILIDLQSLNETNLIGITRSSASNDEDVLVTLQHAGVIDGVPGIETGMTYFMLSDGSLSTMVTCSGHLIGTGIGPGKLLMRDYDLCWKDVES